MQQTISLKSPASLLETAINHIAENVGGYKDGFDGASLLEALLTHDPLEDDDFWTALETLRSVYDRAKGAEVVIDQMIEAGMIVYPEVSLSEEGPTILINGVDHRQPLVDQMDSATAAMKEAGGYIEKLKAELAVAQSVNLRTAAVAQHTEPAKDATAMADTSCGYDAGKRMSLQELMELLTGKGTQDARPTTGPVPPRETA